MKKFIFCLVLSAASICNATPGDLVSLQVLEEVPALRSVAGRRTHCPSETGLNKAFALKIIRVEFRTQDLQGRELSSAGVLMLPQTMGPLPMLVYQHGTLIGRSELPSNNPSHFEAHAIGYCMASLGYGLLSADYLGYGDSTGVHPYLNARSEAWVARDMMRAARIASVKLGFQWSPQIFIAGYSQGGHAAMSLLRFLEEDPRREFQVTAAAPMAGPYDLTKTFSEVLRKPAVFSAAEGAFLVAGLNHVYGIYNSVSDVIQPAYFPLVSTFFDGTHQFKEVVERFPMPPSQLFQPSFLNGDLQNPQSRFRQALAANDVYRWTPRTPLRLYHGEADIEVPFANSVEAYQYMKSTGANVEFVSLGKTIDHGSGFHLAISQAALWFESLRKP